MPSTFEITTALAAPAEEVWVGAVDPDGINFELGPWVSTRPRHAVSRALDARQRELLAARSDVSYLGPAQ